MSPEKIDEAVHVSLDVLDREVKVLRQGGDCGVESIRPSKPLRVHFHCRDVVQGLVDLQRVTEADPIDLRADPLRDISVFGIGEANREIDLEPLVRIMEHPVLHNVVPFPLSIVAPDGSADRGAAELRERHRVGGVVPEMVHPLGDLGREKDNGFKVKDHLFFHLVTCWWVWVVPLCLIAQSLC